MTGQEAEAIVGGSAGIYDGVTGMDTDEPVKKGTWLEWRGAKGVIILFPDRNDRVARSEFFPGREVTCSWRDLAIERLTRQRTGELSPTGELWRAR